MFSPLSTAFVLGFLPPILWLIFWLREDKRRPEPRGRIIFTFLVGALSIIPTFFFEALAKDFFGASLIFLIIVWAFIEEIFKWLAAYGSAIRNRVLSEQPVDVMIYLITAALGFAAAENILFLMNPLSEGSFIEAFSTGSMRFVGSTLLHTLTSGVLGGIIALGFYRRNSLRSRTIVGLILASALHAVFNFLIIGGSGSVLSAFVFVWIAIVGLILLFEKVKKVY